MKKHTLIATAAMGLEALVAKEVRALGYENCTVENSRVTFEGDNLAICRSNLWLRTADRVKIKVAEFKVRTFEELFQGTKKVNWAAYLPADAKFPVIGKSVKSKLYSVPDCQAIVKKAIVEKMKEQYNIEDWLDETGAEYKIEIAITKDVALITLDTSGAGLHKRGYRVKQGEAPLKETLAAALIMLTNWNASKPLVDVFCGSGTLAIEAALIGQNIAPGFNRSFASEKWDFIPGELWDQARQEVEDKANYDEPLQIIGYDIDSRVVEIAKENAMEIGFGDVITFKQGNALDFIPEGDGGVVVGNPPYGERLGELAEVRDLYKKLGQAYAPYDTWSYYFFTAMEDFETYYGKQATKKRKLFNGFIRCDYYQYFGRRPKRVVTEEGK